jgi:hypothetical protein
MLAYVKDMLTEFGRFVGAVDWSQRWLQGLGAYFALLLVVAVVTRRRAAWQAGLLGWCLLMTLLAQPINAAAREHWRAFASANYFGERGLFAAIMFGFPHLVLAVLALVNLLVSTAGLAVTVKRMQLAHERKDSTKKDK